MDRYPELKRVLFVDSDLSFLNMVGKVFSLWSKGSWEILKTDKLEAALPLMERNHVHVMVIDVYSSGHDGVAILRSLHTHLPAVPKIVLSNHPLDAVQQECLENGALRYMQKAGTMEGLEKVFRVIDGFAKAQPEGGFTGTIWVIGLQEVLQLECLHRRSSVMEFTSGRHHGKVYLRNGTIIHAEAGFFKGVIALSLLLALKGGEFKLKPFKAPAEITIDRPWELLLMEAAQKNDEHPQLLKAMYEHSGAIGRAAGKGLNESVAEA
jgi:CheY-like chemotaxis protein